MKKFETLELDVKYLQTGDLICERMDYTPNAALIRYFINRNQPEHLRSPYNHIGMVVCLEDSFPYILEAKGSGTAKLESAKKALNGKKICIRRPKFEFSKTRFAYMALEYSYNATPYDWKGTFWEQLVFQTTGYKKNKSGVEGDEKLYCSEYYARVINRIFPERYPDYYMIDPQDLYIDEEYETIFEGKAVTKC